MTKPSPFFSLVNEETERLKWFGAFMCGRVELEQQTISGLQALLEGAPPLPERKLLWHCALEKLLDGTRDELHSRMEELETLKGQMKTLAMSIDKAEMYIRRLNLKFDELESPENVDSAQVATATSHKDYVSDQKSLTKLFRKEKAAFRKYHEQGEARKNLTYRRTVYQQRQNRKQFLNSVPDRVQKYGTKYWTAVCDVGMVMESFSNYLRNISSTCNSSGSALWPSAKNIKPLVDANFHTEAIEYARFQSPIQFSPIYYQNPGSESRSLSGQTILFGCPLELYTVGELKKIPPVLEYLLDSVQGLWLSPQFSQLEKDWTLANELEDAWTGVEEADRAFISEHFWLGDREQLIMAYFRFLPKPLLSDDDIVMVQDASHQSASLIWNAWSKDPIKAAVIRAILGCVSNTSSRDFYWDMASVLLQRWRYGRLETKNLLEILEKYPDIWRSPVSNAQQATNRQAVPTEHHDTSSASYSVMLAV